MEEINHQKQPPVHIEHDYDDDSSDSSDSSSSSSSSDSDSSDSSDDSSDDDSRSRRSNNYRNTATKTLRQFSPNVADNDNRVEPKAYRKEPSPFDDRRDRGGSRENYSRSNKYNNSRGKDELNSPASTTSSRRTGSPSFSTSSRGRDTSRDRRSAVRSRSPSRESPRYSRTESSSRGNTNAATNKVNSSGSVSSSLAPPPPSSSRNDTLMDLLLRFPVLWQGYLGLKNETAAVQMHFISGWFVFYNLLLNILVS